LFLTSQGSLAVLLIHFLYRRHFKWTRCRPCPLLAHSESCKTELCTAHTLWVGLPYNVCG